MRGSLKAALLGFVCLLLVFSQSVAAWNVTKLVIDPSGPVTFGTPINVTGTIDFAPASGPDMTFDHSHELVLSTTLSDARWDLTLVVGEAMNPQPSVFNNSTTLSGFLLSYPKRTDESLKIRLTGNAPGTGVPCTSSGRTILLVQEYDAQHSPVPGTSRALDTVIVYSGDCVNRSNEKRASLSAFRIHIDQKAGLGINTTLAEEKYAEADAMIKSAIGRPPAQYLSAYEDLEAVQKAIDDGEMALDRAWAEKEVADAQVPITKVDAVIAWFKGNSSTADDPKLPAIMIKREIAFSYLETARGEITNGRFEQARAKAQDAYNKGNESYNDACQQSRIPGCGNNPPLKPGVTIAWMIPFKGIIIVSIIAGILCVVIFFWWRKRKRWNLE